MVIRVDSLEKSNAKILADLVADPYTTDLLRVKILTELLESREGQDFFQTMYEEGLSFGACPCCGHENHWAVPEDILNTMNYVSHINDSRIKEHTTIDDCEEYQEACRKKKITV